MNDLSKENKSSYDIGDSISRELKSFLHERCMSLKTRRAELHEELFKNSQELAEVKEELIAIGPSSELDDTKKAALVNRLNALKNIRGLQDDLLKVRAQSKEEQERADELAQLILNNNNKQGIPFDSISVVSSIDEADFKILTTTENIQDVVDVPKEGEVVAVNDSENELSNDDNFSYETEEKFINVEMKINNVDENSAQHNVVKAEQEQMDEEDIVDIVEREISLGTQEFKVEKIDCEEDFEDLIAIMTSEIAAGNEGTAAAAAVSRHGSIACQSISEDDILLSNDDEHKSEKVSKKSKNAPVAVPQHKRVLHPITLKREIKEDMLVPSAVVYKKRRAC